MVRLWLLTAILQPPMATQTNTKRELVFFLLIRIYLAKESEKRVNVHPRIERMENEGKKAAQTGQKKAQKYTYVLNDCESLLAFRIGLVVSLRPFRYHVLYRISETEPRLLCVFLITGLVFQCKQSIRLSFYVHGTHGWVYGATIGQPPSKPRVFHFSAVNAVEIGQFSCFHIEWNGLYSDILKISYDQMATIFP